MALNILQTHAQVFLDTLGADNGPPALIVLDGSVPRDASGAPSTPPPYVLVYIAFRPLTGSGDAGTVGLEEAAAEGFYTIATCHSVGGNQLAALAVQGRVRAALLGLLPVVDDRECGPVKHVDGQPVQRDETTGVLVSDAVSVWEFLSLPG